MNYVIYSSRSGNTKKLAQAIASGIGVTAYAAGSGIKIDYADTLFVGSALYAGKIHPQLQAFLKNLAACQVGTVVVFGTSLSGSIALAQIQAILAPKGIRIADNTLKVKGSFLWMNRGRPNEKDLNIARDFGKEITAQNT
jgi:flavodoxin I